MTWLVLLIGVAAAGWVLGLRRRVVLTAVAALWLLLLIAYALPLRPGTALDPQAKIMLVLGVCTAILWGYLRALSALRRRARSPGPPRPVPVPGRDPAQNPVLSEAEIDRYARHIVLRDIGGPGQMRLRTAKVLVIGAGGLGAPVCLYLAGAGVGQITIADDDSVSLSNLQRQVIFRSDQQGQPKSDAAAQAMSALNPHIVVNALSRRVTDDDIALIGSHDLVLDGTDSFSARHGINRACVAAGVPLVAGAISQWEGQITMYDPARGGPCLACLFPAAPAPGMSPPCAEAAVAGPLPGVVGSMMALEAIKYITGAGQGLRGRMLIFDGLYGDSRMIATARRADCPVCQRQLPFQSGSHTRS